MEDSIKYKVCVRCFTYNQSKYITQTMNGFVFQQTEFPFVCCIVDDASSDGEQGLIIDYLHLNFDMSDDLSYEKETDSATVIYARHRGNKNCFFAVVLLKENHWRKKSKMPYISEWRDNSKYEAVCEGDDFWCSSKKLQEGVLELDSDDEVGIVYTDFEYIDSDNRFIDPPKVEPYISLKSYFRSGYIWHYLLNGECGILTCTIIYRLSLLTDEIRFLDLGTFMMITRQSKAVFLDSKSSCYRILNNSLMRSHSHYIDETTARTQLLQLFYYYETNTTAVFYQGISTKIQVSRYILRFIKNNRHLKFANRDELLKAILLKHPSSFLYIPLCLLTELVKQITNKK